MNIYETMERITETSEALVASGRVQGLTLSERQLEKDERCIIFQSDAPDKTELVLGDDFEIKVEDDKTFVVRKKPQYPKTYEECCEVLGIEEDLWFVYEDIDANHINPACISNYRMRRLDLYHNLEKLIICRDAYWKIAGEQVGLGKPWGPDWESVNTTKYVISRVNNKIELFKAHEYNYTLAFPTSEMRDTFYDNFKELIEACKELL